MEYVKKTIVILIIVCSTSLNALGVTPDPKMKKVVSDALDFSVKQSMQMYDVIKDMDNKFPRAAKQGELITCDAKWWTSGFYPGTLWYLYEYSQDSTVMTAAEVMTERVLGEQYTTTNHDVGFQINCSAGNGYRITGREEYRSALINAGNSLSTRFGETVGLIRSWNSRRYQFSVIIDNMMNLELLTVSSSLTGDNTQYTMAKSHADQTIINHMRPDGSSFQVVSYDTITAQVINQITSQGVNNHSTWSRGQSWAIYGFTMMYRQTGKKEYLDQAVKASRFVMNHPRLPKDKIPYWDFDAPNIPKETRDASAGAIIASALVELSTFVDENTGRELLKFAEQQIRSLASPAYRAKLGRNNNFILMHSTGFTGKNYEIDEPIAYADYYFIEALMRYKRLLEGRPVVDLQTAFSEIPDRAKWLSALDRVSKPLLKNMSRGELKKNMPVESNASDITSRYKVTYLEALGRLLVGISPWLELGPDNTPEGRLRAQYIEMAVKSITNGVDPDSPDYLNFNEGRQPLVDAAFLAHALLRAPNQLWGRLDNTTKSRLLKELKSSLVIKPSETNWLFFAAMVECALKEYSGEWDYSKVKYALDRHQEWYKGDGWYGDGKDFHLDYYNSFVIQPMMMQVLETAKKQGITDIDELLEIQKIRYARYAEQQERLISPEGTYPVIGRSIAYRFGAYQALSDVAYRRMLPEKVSPAQVRCGMTAVISRQINAPNTFDNYGWLRVGFAGHQPDMGETYISTGSLYLCAAGFIALGLPENDEFWNSPEAMWTSHKAWNGIDIGLDKAIKQ